MKPKNQNDIVNVFLQEQNFQAEESEDVFLPGLKNWFEPVPINATEDTMNFKHPDLPKLNKKPRHDIALMLASLLDLKPGITGFKWILGKPSIEVYYVENFEQKSMENEAQADKFLKLIEMILKLRGGIAAVEWHFGQEYLTLTSVENN